MGTMHFPAITELSPEETVSLVTGHGEPSYRARQIRTRVYKGLAWDWDELTDLPKILREQLATTTPLHGLAVEHRQKSADGTVKGLFRLRDGHTVEAALMTYPKGNGGRATVCVSTQVGCAVGCPFCATGTQGFERNLTSGEIVDQVLYFGRLLRDEAAAEGSGLDAVTNVVFMGMGEPLANYEKLWQAVEKLNAADGFGLGARNMTISTAGMAPQIRQLGRERLQVGLAVSLHAGTDALRDELVPLNRKYPLAELIDACRDYYFHSGRRVSFEYVLFEGVNDAPTEARAVADLLQGMNCHVNLIPANGTGKKGYRTPQRAAITAFQDELRRRHVKTTVRQSRGKDIDAGCGQLRSRYKKQG